MYLPFSIVSLIWCCQSLTSTQIKLLDGYKCNKTRTWARADCITGCAFLLANVYLYWGYTQSVCCLLESRALRVSSRGRLLGHLSVLFLPMQSVGCARGNRRWIRWRERRQAIPYLLPFPSDPAPTHWVQKPAPRFLTTGERA